MNFSISNNSATKIEFISLDDIEDVEYNGIALLQYLKYM